MLKKPIKRRERVEQTICSINNQLPFENYTEAYKTFLTTFDRIEMSASEHNQQVNDGSREMIYMVVPVPIEYEMIPGIRYSIMTKHFIMFSQEGAIALYRKIPGEIHTDIIRYKDNPLSQPLLNKLSACGKNVWGEQIIQHI